MTRKIAIISHDKIQIKQINQLLTQTSYNMVGQAEEMFGALSLCKTHMPDLVLLNSRIPRNEAFCIGKVLTRQSIVGGVILLCNKEDTLQELLDAMNPIAVVINEFLQDTLLPSIEAALRQVHLQQDKQDRIEQLVKKLEERKTIEKAKVILAKQYNTTEEKAYTYMRKTSMDKRMSIGEIASIITLAYCEINE